MAWNELMPRKCSDGSSLVLIAFRWYWISGMSETADM